MIRTRIPEDGERVKFEERLLREEERWHASPPNLPRQSL